MSTRKWDPFTFEYVRVCLHILTNIFGVIILGFDFYFKSTGSCSFSNLFSGQYIGMVCDDQSLFFLT